MDEKLRRAALDFASEKGMYSEVVAEMICETDDSKCKNEKKALGDGGMAPVPRETVTVEVSDNDWKANSTIGQFTVCL